MALNPTTAGGLHFPGDSYLGPGTKVVQKIYSGVQPASYNDYVARNHDIDYISNKEPIIADIKAILKSGPGLDGMALRLGLSARALVDFLSLPMPWHKYTHFNKSLTGSDEQDTVLQQELRRFVSGGKGRW